MESSEFIARLHRINELASLDETTKTDILAKFNILFDERTKGYAKSLINDKYDTYSVLCTPEVMWIIHQDTKEAYFVAEAVRHPKLGDTFSSFKKCMDFLAGLEKDTNGLIRSSGSNVQATDVKKALGFFNLPKIEVLDDDEDVIGEDELGDNFYSDAFSSDDFDTMLDDVFEDTDMEEDEDEDPGEPEDYGDIEDKEDIGDFSGITGEEAQEPWEQNESGSRNSGDARTEENTAFEENGDKEISIEDIEAVWKDKASALVKNVMESYKLLYSSGYGLISPAGVMTDKGVVRSNSNGQLSFSDSQVLDIEIYNAVLKALGTQNTFELYNYDEPNIRELIDQSKPMVYVMWHLKCMFGHYKFCGASLKNKVADIYDPNRESKQDIDKLPSKTKVLKYSDIVPWIKDKLNEYVYKAYKDAGITTEITSENIRLANAVNMKLSESLKNVIIVAERKKNVNTRIRICTDRVIPVEHVISSLTESLNLGNSKSVRLQQIGNYENGVLDLNIIYNDKAYSQDSLFAYQVLDILEEQGIRPSWDNVILGKKKDGTIMTYNFKSTKNPIYALYASSRAGKGVMTLNLITSALADGCTLMYLDGKPDMATTLGNVAWGKGKEAFVFNGVQGIRSVLELDNPLCKRPVSPFYDIGNVPKGIFRTEDNLKKFAELTTYMRGLELMCKIAKERTASNPKEWLVVIFDEVKQVSASQANILNKMDEALAMRKKEKGPDGKPINEKTDELCIFIKSYKEWLADINEDFITCVSSTFGFANMTVFFVWQETDFPEHYRGSVIANAVISAQSKIIKIVGARAAMKNGSTVFGTPASLKDCKWYDENFTDEKKGGYFAIGAKVDSDDSMVVFRPFNVYSDAKGKSKILENAAASGLSESDLIGVSLDENGNVINEVGFEGYATKLLARFGLDPATQLEKGFVYANDMVQQLGLGDSLLNYMYNCHEFGSKVSGMPAGIADTSEDDSKSKVSEGFDIDRFSFGDNDLEDVSEDIHKNEQRTVNKTKSNTGLFGGYSGAVSFDEEDPIIDKDELKVKPNLMELSRSGVNFFSDDNEDDEIIDFEDSTYETPESSMDKDYIEDDDILDFWNDEDDPIQKAAKENIDSSAGDFVDQSNTSENTNNTLHDTEEADARNRVFVNPRDILNKILIHPEEMPFSQSKTAEATGNGSRRFRITPEGTSNAWELTDENCILAMMPSYDTSERFSNRFFRTIKGTSWEFERRWAIVLKSVAARVSSRDLVTRIELTEDSFSVNKRYVALVGVLGGFEDIQFKDIVNIAAMAKKFRNIKELKMDKAIYNVVLLEAGDEEPVEYLFRILSNLQVLRVIGAGDDGRTVKIDRSGFKQMHSQLERMRNEEKLKAQMKAVAASKDPRFSERSPGEQLGAFKSAGQFFGPVRDAARSQYKKSSRSFIGGTTLSFLTAGAIVTGAVFGTVARAWGWLNKR